MPNLPAPEVGNISRFETSLRQRSAVRGKSVAELLQDERIALRQSSYPGPECLNPYEVEQFFVADLNEDRLMHVEKCPMCAALIDAAQPTENGLAQFISKYRVKKATKSIAELGNERPNSAIWRPLSDLLWVEGPVIAACVLLGIGISRIDDTITQNVLSMIAWRSITIVCVVALGIALLTFAGAKWVRLAQGASFQRFGGAAVGGVFAALVVFYGAKIFNDVNTISSNLEIAQNALLTALADQHKIGGVAAKNGLEMKASPDGNMLSASSTKFPGILMAQREQNSIEVYWDDLGKRRSLGTIHQGTLEHGPNGEAKVFTGTEKISVKPNWFEQMLGNGTRVLALVPTNDDEASTIVPINKVAGGD